MAEAKVEIELSVKGSKNVAKDFAQQMEDALAKASKKLGLGFSSGVSSSKGGVGATAAVGAALQLGMSAMTGLLGFIADTLKDVPIITAIMKILKVILMLLFIPLIPILKPVLIGLSNLARNMVELLKDPATSDAATAAAIAGAGIGALLGGPLGAVTGALTGIAGTLLIAKTAQEEAANSTNVYKNTQQSLDDLFNNNITPNTLNLGATLKNSATSIQQATSGESGIITSFGGLATAISAVIDWFNKLSNKGSSYQPQSSNVPFLNYITGQSAQSYNAGQSSSSKTPVNVTVNNTLNNLQVNTSSQKREVYNLISEATQSGIKKCVSYSGGLTGGS